MSKQLKHQSNTFINIEMFSLKEILHLFGESSPYFTPNLHKNKSFLNMSLFSFQ